MKGPRALFKPNQGFMQDFSLGEWGGGGDACQGHMRASVHPLRNSGHAIIMYFVIVYSSSAVEAIMT